MTSLDKAISNLGIKRTINFSGKQIKLACLLREEDRRPLQADWWKGKQSTLIGVDDNGNFLLRHCGGYIFYWCHQAQFEEVIAKSEGEFLKLIEFGE
ncbi:hypothetical protein [Microbulbifer sp. PAAF003]|uniref:hypothetical protein n=1 Tax=Microbulbifer sp. PAAF003 TaxID=3243375 RepID=UPI004039F820